MRRFYVMLYGVTALSQVPVALGVLLLVGGTVGWVAGGVVALLVVGLFIGRVRIAQWDEPISTLRRHALEEPYFVHWCASLLALVLFVLVAPSVLWTGWSVLAVAAAVYAFALPFAVWGVLVRRRWVRVRELTIPVARLPAAFDGYRVAQLSDLHVGSHCPRERVDRWVERVNALSVDLVALTGDYVTSGVRYHEDIAGALGELSAADGVFAVMGNHDYYGDGEPLMTLMREGGIRLLRNEHVRVHRGEEALVVAGVDDIYTKRIDIDATMEGIALGETVLMLAHDPRSFPELAERGCSLVLSGHTHWGQVGVPFLSALFNYARLMTPYHADRHTLGDAELYVHPGLGTTGPPVRLGTAPELTVITLRCRTENLAPEAADR